jgi:hypothetical protein
VKLSATDLESVADVEVTLTEAHGHVFRAINKAGQVWGDGMTPKVTATSDVNRSCAWPSTTHWGSNPNAWRDPRRGDGWATPIRPPDDGYRGISA